MPQPQPQSGPRCRSSLALVSMLFKRQFRLRQQARPRRSLQRRFSLAKPAGILRIGAVRVYQRETELRTAGGLSVRDITEEVNEAVAQSGITEGIACIHSPHTTCCVRVNEFETGFIEDFSELLRRLVPSETYYAHDDWDKRTENICPEDMDFGNGHSHCMAMLLGTAGESVPVRDG
jgi:secondary thiamine-phosphate synthase enzyme